MASATVLETAAVPPTMVTACMPFACRAALVSAGRVDVVVSRIGRRWREASPDTATASGQPRAAEALTPSTRYASVPPTSAATSRAVSKRLAPAMRRTLTPFGAQPVGDPGAERTGAADQDRFVHAEPVDQRATSRGGCWTG